MAQIHQLLPVVTDAEQQRKKIIEETVKVFGKKELFEGHHRTLAMRDEERKFEEQGAEEVQELTTTVIERLLYEVPFHVRVMDAQLQKALANQGAVADLTLPEGTIIPGMPVSFLMDLEKELTYFRSMLDAAPTYATTVAWIYKDSSMVGVWESATPVVSNRTERKKVPIVLVKATEKHPAQCALVEEDVVIGVYSKTSITGKLTPHQKHALIERTDALITAVKKAKAEANNAQVPNVAIGKVIMDSIMSVLK